MPKRKSLFEENEDDDDETGNSPTSFRVNEKYATAYGKWRQKEEFQKLKDRYGDVSLADEDESDESSEDENPFEDLTPAEERDFLKKLALVKSGDYRTYKADEEETSRKGNDLASETTTKRKKGQQMFLKDYERKVILEREGRLSDDDDEDPPHASNQKQKSYVEQQKEIKESFKTAFESDDEDEGDFLKARKKTAQEEEQEDEEYLLWLKGQKDEITDEKVVNDLKPLRDYWTDSKLDEGERFLRDYILNRQYLGGEDNTEAEGRIPSYGEIVGDDEGTLEDDEDELRRQEEFEQKYNFRYEEPDAEFIKTYPRTVADSLRRKEEKRKQKRDDYKKRKEDEKNKQIEEVKELKNLKRREIMNRLERLRRTAGIDNLSVDLKQLDDDFDPADYDRMMEAAFGDNYYATNDEEKPQFSEDEEIDKEGEEAEDLANWDDWTGGGDAQSDLEENDDKPGPSTSKSGSRKRPVSHFADAVTKKKPLFDPAKKKFQEYFDEYYKLDFEDIIGGDIRCRFKYRDVPANDFGLSVGEILMAKDKELNSWVSVKKMSQYRSKDEETYDQKAYKAKARDSSKKQRLLHSVFGEKDESATSTPANEEKSVSTPSAVLSKKRRKKKKKSTGQSNVDITLPSPSAKPTLGAKAKAKRKKKGRFQRKKTLVEKLSDERLASYGVNAKKLKNRVKYSRIDEAS